MIEPRIELLTSIAVFLANIGAAWILDILVICSPGLCSCLCCSAAYAWWGVAAPRRRTLE
jgi:hypothetical protein